MTPYYNKDGIAIYHGDCHEVLPTLEPESVHCCVTSPPYWGLRDYGTDNQLGLESTPEKYVGNLVAVFSEVRRVLRDDGTLWLNLGDSYFGGGNNRGNNSPISSKQASNMGATGQCAEHAKNIRKIDGLKPKDLVGIPWRVALALQQPYTVPTCVKSEVDRAWLAAMFDGEGCIGIRRFKSYREEKQQVYQDGFVVYTVVTNNDKELLDRCIEITGLGKVRLKQKAGNTDDRGIVSRRDSYGWRLDGNGAMDVIRAIYPYLIAKRRQAIIAATLDLSNKSGTELRGWQKPLPKSEQEKRGRLKQMINDCNQRRPVDLPSWCVEPTQKVEPGWYLRSDIIWHKPNPMPESVTDRPTKSHEYIFLLTKNAKYYYDHEAVKEEAKYGRRSTFRSANYENNNAFNNSDTLPSNGSNLTKGDDPSAGRNRRSVWTIPTQPFKGAHFAVFPSALIEPCVKAGCPEGGVVLDPFTGSGTVAVVASKNGCRFVGCELNEIYFKLIAKRLEQKVFQWE